MDISEFIKETIRQVCDGITWASRDCSQLGVIVNPAISVGESGDFFTRDENGLSRFDSDTLSILWLL